MRIYVTMVEGKTVDFGANEEIIKRFITMITSPKSQICLITFDNEGGRILINKDKVILVEIK